MWDKIIDGFVAFGVLGFIAFLYIMALGRIKYGL